MVIKFIAVKYQSHLVMHKKCSFFLGSLFENSIKNSHNVEHVSRAHICQIPDSKFANRFEEIHPSYMDSMYNVYDIEVYNRHKLLATTAATKLRIYKMP